jgi:NaMN:DMB phosphoribosyltransferase
VTRFALVAGTTATARADGTTSDGVDSDLLDHSPSADAELIEYGRLVRVPTHPASPVPAAVTRAARQRVGFETLVVDAGLAEPTGAPTVDVGAKPGRDVREADPVPTAPGAWVAARELGGALPDDELVIGESIPGGATTALGVCRALGVDGEASATLRGEADDPVTASLAPLGPEQSVIEAGFEASDVAPGDAAYRPELAVRFLGDPVLAVVAGLTAGALESGTEVVLGGGPRLLAAAALLRHAGVAAPLTVATTTSVADATLSAAAEHLDCDLVVTDPGFERRDDALASDAATAGAGAGAGGALLLAERAGALGGVADGTLEVMECITDSHGP